MQLKAEANEEPRKRHHMVNKLRKAESYAQELANMRSEDTRLNSSHPSRSRMPSSA